MINAQRIDNLGKAKPVSISGGFSANSIFYNGTANRDPFTYFLNGTINVNLYGLYNIPVSFAYTNQKFTFNEPSFKINRLSIHPSYKWITTHIGDVSMNFSPYTLNGHQFTGFGVDLTPNGPFKISAMYGRLVRDRAYDINEPQVDPSYKRMGFGTKIVFDKNNYGIGVSLFKAKDKLNSLEFNFPDDLRITPKENLVISFEGRVKLFDKANIRVEFANSALTNDLRADKIKSNQWLASLVSNKTSTVYHNAFKVDFSYIIGNGSLGVGYERVAPQYQTLGAYYFNNDLENITVKLNQTLFKNKLNVAINTGLQHDDLNNQKQSELNRIVAAINLNLKASDKLTVAGSYSNFRAHTQLKNQFDYINQVRPYENIDTLNFTQVSQNSNLNINYALSQLKEKRQSLNINVSYQNITEDQDAFLVNAPKNDSEFINGNLAYNLTLTERNLSITGAFNSTYNTVTDSEVLTMGPTLAIAKQFFDRKMRTTFSTSYNTTATNGKQQGNVLNFRFGSTYRFKEKHNFNLAIIQLFRNTTTQQNINDFTATIGYTYSFSSRKRRKNFGKTVKEKQVKKEKQPQALEKLIKINYKGHHFEGPPSLITRQLDTINNHLSENYRTQTELDKLNSLLGKVKTSEKEEVKDYKKSVHKYLDAYDAISITLKAYQKEVKLILRELATDILQSHDGLEKRYIQIKGKFNSLSYEEKNKNDTKKVYEEVKQQFIHHSWILRQLQRPEVDVLEKLHIFKGSMLNEIENMKRNGNSKEQIAAQIKMAIIAFYDEQATEFATEKDLLLLNR